ncbi:hypothetical protein ACHHYP_02918 [Achlya hypogyna]|uniref:Uncharacterized protein n=1 Tax=Achlya hypogyna TaxID=1202772 RepID=A0A1V9Z533_ACHHY|nr:hypothetical protein ACHHYP_02918 [Achlya hypogyna]
MLEEAFARLQRCRADLPLKDQLHVVYILYHTLEQDSSIALTAVFEQNFDLLCDWAETAKEGSKTNSQCNEIMSVLVRFLELHLPEGCKAKRVRIKRLKRGSAKAPVAPSAYDSIHIAESPNDPRFVCFWKTGKIAFRGASRKAIMDQVTSHGIDVSQYQLKPSTS